MKAILNMRKVILAVCAGLLIVTIGACSDRDTRHSRINHSLDYMAYRLSFDESQKAIVDKLKLELADIRTETVQQRQQLREQRFAAASQWLNADVLATEQMSAELEQLLVVHKQQADEMLHRIWPIVNELHSSLNAEQKAKLEKKLLHWQEKGQEKGQHRG